MPVTYLNQGQNTFNTGSGGSTPSANKIVTVKTWAEALEPRRTPLLTKIGFGDPLDQRPWYWGQSQRTAKETTLGEAVSIAETEIDLASGAGVLCQVGSVLEVVDFIAGSTTILDQSTREIMIVTDISTDTVTVLKAQGGTTDQAHASGAKVFIIGSAEIENGTHSLSAISRGFQFYNYFQRFQGGVSADKAVQNMPTWEHPTNVMLSDFKDVTADKKLELEMAVWRGGRQAGSTTVPALMGGMDTFITTNVTNLAQAKITFRLLEAELRDLARNTDGGPEGLTLLMSYNTAAIFDLAIDSIRQATASDNKITLALEKVAFRFGTFDIMVSHWCRDGVIYGVRPEKMKVHPFKGLDWHIGKKEGAVHGVDKDEMYISGDFTLVLQNEAAMFKIHTFNEDLTAYEGYNAFAN